MSETLHIPLYRAGKAYRSMNSQPLIDIRTGESIGEMSQAHYAVIARDQRHQSRNQAALERMPVTELIDITKRAADIFMKDELPVGDGGATQSPEDYLQQLAATAGLPVAMGQLNMEKIHGVMANIENVLEGLTRSLDLNVLDGGYGEVDGHLVSYQRQCDSLGGVLPNNSPGVHGLWVPAIALKMPLVLRPGSAEPWTPFRLAEAFFKAGCPREAFSLYPSDHSGTHEILLRTHRSIFFGDKSTVERWNNRGGIQIHGPGWSKVIFGPDAAQNWQEHVDMIAASVVANGGRSCINCSGVWTSANGREIAAAIAEKLAKVDASGLDDPEAGLAAFPNPDVARAISDMVDDSLRDGTAEDMTAQFRDGDRVSEAGGCTFLRPTVIYTNDPDHPLARAEYIFPFVTVVEVPEEEVLSTIGPTLIGTVVSEDNAFRGAAMTNRHIDRLNLGPIPTYQISWDQPHEGNLFDHLYQQRSFQLTKAS